MRGEELEGVLTRYKPKFSNILFDSTSDTKMGFLFRTRVDSVIYKRLEVTLAGKSAKCRVLANIGSHRSKKRLLKILTKEEIGIIVSANAEFLGSRKGQALEFNQKIG